MSGLDWLFGAGAALLLGGAVLPLLRSRTGEALALQVLGVGLIGVGGALVLFGAPAAGAGFSDGLDPRLGVDGLTGLFLVTVAIAAVPALVFAHDYLAGIANRRAQVTLLGAFLLSLCGLVAARDPSSFLACWELMTLVPAAAILVGRSDGAVRHAVFVYLAMTHLGGAGVWI